ncbi:hypothetical protein EC973_001407 [Apophysomyces ossiformis]|uniref:Uncharacterized protein n=1 Tax=Apophysomyces ossiformis TaxID=679940 RepID=A0A8H7BJU6_9FUNG|nr:hypothetical protein EC973_001407 [Apophysomyces ossiformis]
MELAAPSRSRRANANPMQHMPTVPQPQPELQPLTFEHHESLPSFMTQIMEELNSQRQKLLEHDTIYEQLRQLQQELTAAQRRIAELEHNERQLRAQLANGTTATTVDSQYDTQFPPLPPATQTSSASQWARPLPKQRPQPSPETQQRRQAEAARAFIRPIITHGFKYLYLPARARIPTGQMRARLRKLGIDNSRILDIHYPDRQVIALLIHNDFEQTLLDQLNRFGITTLTYDPLDPVNLRDPKYKDKPTMELSQIAFEVHYDRMAKALQYIRPPVKYAVARTFAENDWIPIEHLKQLLSSRWNNHTDDCDLFQLPKDDADTSMNDSSDNLSE